MQEVPSLEYLMLSCRDTGQRQASTSTGELGCVWVCLPCAQVFQQTPRGYQMVLSVCAWLIVCTCGWEWAWECVWLCVCGWLGLRVPPTQFFCSLSREAVSPGPFSGRANGGEGCGLGGREQGRVVPAPVPVPREEGDVWGKGVRLQGGGVGWRSEEHTSELQSR